MVLKEIYKTTDNRGVELDLWLDKEENVKKINNMRCFYVIKANAESSTDGPSTIKVETESELQGKPKVTVMDVFKIGIAGEKGGTGAYGRLSQYILAYGRSGPLNPCVGVRLFYLAGNVYNPNVSIENSEIFKRELFMKRELKERGLISRGRERTKAALNEILCVAQMPIKKFDDEATKLRTSKREALKTAKQKMDDEAQLLQTDEVIEVMSHKPVRPDKKFKGKTEYKLKWNRPFSTDKGKVNFTFETLEQAIGNDAQVEDLGGNLGAVDLIEDYQDSFREKNKNAKFID